MIFWVLLTAYMATRVFASTLIISQNTITTNGVTLCSLGDGILIDEDIFWSVFSEAEVCGSFLQVDVGGAYFITNSQDSVSLDLKNFINNGVVSIDPTKFYSENRFQISGSQIFNNGRFFLSNPASILLSAESWNNTAAIIISGEQIPGESGNQLAIVTMESSEDYLSNSGIICLVNQFYEMTTQLTGEGCVHILDNSIFYVNKMDTSKPLDNIIVLHGANSRFIYVPCGGTYTVAGFGEGSTIEVQYQTPIQYQYDDQSGILTMSSAGYTDNFYIGLGYMSDYFELWGGELALTYNGPVPNQIPSNCGTCPSVPVAPTSL